MEGSSALADAMADNMAGRHWGKYRGRVDDNRDPEALGRLRVVVPALLGERTPIWAMPCVPYAGRGVGWFVMPPVGAGVWVEFEGGDLDYPIWTGCFWTDSQSPPGGGSDPATRVWKTETVTIRIDDSAGEITIETRGGAKLKLTATENKIEALTVEHTAALGKIVLSATGLDVNNGAFTVI